MSLDESTDATRVMREAMELDPSDRIDLSIALWQSVHRAVDMQETEENRQPTVALLNERVRQIESGEVECVSWEQAKRDILARLGR